MEEDSLKEQLNVACAKLKIIEVTTNKKGQELNMLLPKGTFSKSLLRLAGRLSRGNPSVIPTEEPVPDESDTILSDDRENMIKVERLEESQTSTTFDNHTFEDQSGCNDEYLRSKTTSKTTEVAIEKNQRQTIRVIKANVGNMASPIIRVAPKRDILVQDVPSEQPKCKKRRTNYYRDSTSVAALSPDSGWNSGENSDSSPVSTPQSTGKMILIK